MRSLAVGVLLLACLSTARSAGRSAYDVRYEVTVVPSERGARVAIHLGKGADHVRWIRFRTDPLRHRNFEGDGEISVDGNTVEWRPPGGPASLRYFFSIDHLRDERSYDARCSSRWALFRGDDLVPPARVRASKDATARARLRLRLPEGWSAALPYAGASAGEYAVSHPKRNFDRPTGWFVMGDLGVVREEIAGTRVAIAGPSGHRLRRQDLLAFLTWTLPALSEALGGLPPRLLIVGAGDPMWRGGLSGPNSVFIHAERPMISEDGTSPILHEVVHASMGVIPASGGDWIVEGLAEVYSLEALVRSGTIDARRYSRARARLAERGRSGGPLAAPSVAGSTQARAATLLYELDEGIRKASEGERSLDDVVRRLMESGEPASTAGLRAIAEDVAGRDLDAIFREVRDDR